MSFGVTASGFVLKRQSDIQSEMAASMQSAFGVGFNFGTETPEGQELGIFQFQLAQAWETMEAIYDSMYPNSASDVSLDNVVAITGIERLPASFSYGNSANDNQETLLGVLGTVIPVGSLISVQGNPNIVFQTLEDVTLGAGTNAVQNIAFSLVPDAGGFTLLSNGNQTGNIPFSAVASDVQTALNALPGLSGVTVSGTFTGSFNITYAGASGSTPQPLLVVGANTLTSTSTNVSLTITQTTPGVLPNANVDVQCTTLGANPAFAGSLNVINSIVPGWTSCFNENDMTLGANVETDAQLRIRRGESLSEPGSANPDAILAKVRAVPGVVNASIDNNVTLITNGNGTPGKAFQVIVLGGADTDIAIAIWSVIPSGILSYGTTSVTIEDASGNPQVVSFSRPTPVDINMAISLHPTSDYPAGGDEAVKEAIVAFGQANYSVGKNVIFWQLNVPIFTIAGIDNLIYTINSGSVDISISALEISNWSTSFISITHT